MRLLESKIRSVGLSLCFFSSCILMLCSSSFCAEAVIPENILICGVCKNVASRLPDTIKIIEQIGSLFNDYRVLVYEDNSFDGTQDILKQWMIRNPKVRAQFEMIKRLELKKDAINIQLDHQMFRPEAIARARNIVLGRALSEEFQEFDFIIWVDMDFVIPPAFEGIVEIFESHREWDAVFAYGMNPEGDHWDWYALRDAIYPIGSELLGDEWWNMTKQLSLDSFGDWYPVYSAFGGCGIYKKSSIAGCRYSAIVTDDLEQIAKIIIDQGIKSQHPLILKYQNSLKDLQKVVKIDRPACQLPRIRDPSAGIILNDRPDALIWRMSSHVYQYPSVCEHVPFHATMIVNGHNKLFINPRLIFRYGG